MKNSVLLWFQYDLRIRDNAAFAAALESGCTVIPVFIWDQESLGSWEIGSASQVFLHGSLLSLKRSLEEHGLPLVLRTGRCEAELELLLKETKAERVYWNRRYEPALVKRDSEIKRSLREGGVIAESFNSSLLVEPWEVTTQQGRPFQVFTPFWNRAKSVLKKEPLEVDLRSLRRPESSPESVPLDKLGLLPDHPWGGKVAAQWEPGEGAGERALADFLQHGLEEYEQARDIPSRTGTSRLSPYLRWGLIGPRQIWQAVEATGMADGQGAQVFLKEIGWREFAYHVLYHFPHTPGAPLREKYENFPWIQDSDTLESWKGGQTGYPIVDAGMRQLWEEGWMHNRVRMVVGSFLVKHLLHSWVDGARWFWDCLVDADLASNTLGWQWAGGCGADAAPYFRVFNPMTQGKKFDPQGAYVRRYVPELANLPAKYIHEPWEASEGVLAESGVRLGENYPHPIIDHKKGRERALAAFEKVKG